MSLKTKLNWIERNDLQTILERHGFAVYDSEDVDDLRDAVESNINDGTIPENELDEYL